MKIAKYRSYISWCIGAFLDVNYLQISLNLYFGKTVIKIYKDRTSWKS